MSKQLTMTVKLPYVEGMPYIHEWRKTSQSWGAGTSGASEKSTKAFHTLSRISEHVPFMCYVRITPDLHYDIYSETCP